MQRRRPGIEHGLAVWFAHLADQIELALPRRAQVVVVLHADGHAELRRPPRAFPQRFHHQRPLTPVFRRWILVACEHSYQVAAQVARELRQRRHVVDLKFALRNLGVFQVRREVGVGRDANAAHAASFDLLPQPRPLARSPIEHRQVRPFAPQHHALKAQLRRALDELLQPQCLLAPRSGVAHRKKECVQHAIVPPTSPGTTDACGVRTGCRSRCARSVPRTPPAGSGTARPFRPRPCSPRAATAAGRS